MRIPWETPQRRDGRFEQGKWVRGKMPASGIEWGSRVQRGRRTGIFTGGAEPRKTEEREKSKAYMELLEDPSCKKRVGVLEHTGGTGSPVSAKGKRLGYAESEGPGVR